MLKSTSKAEQFYTRSGSESTKGSRKGFSLLGGGEDPLKHMSPEERRASLVAVWKGLQVQLAQAKRENNEYLIKTIRNQINEIGHAINSIRPKRRSPRPEEIAYLFIDICREQMTKPQFNAIMDEANRRQRATLKQK